MLFATSIADNIAYGRDSATMEEVTTRPLGSSHPGAPDLVCWVPVAGSCGHRRICMVGHTTERLLPTRGTSKAPIVSLLA